MRRNAAIPFDTQFEYSSTLMLPKVGKIDHCCSILSLECHLLRALSYFLLDKNHCIFNLEISTDGGGSINLLT